jgi:hypothetical protein
MFATLSRAMDGYKGAQVRMSSAVVAMVTGGFLNAGEEHRKSKREA